MSENSNKNDPTNDAILGCVIFIAAPFGLQAFWNSWLMSNGENQISYWTALVGYLFFLILK